MVLIDRPCAMGALIPFSGSLISTFLDRTISFQPWNKPDVILSTVVQTWTRSIQPWYKVDVTKWA